MDESLFGPMFEAALKDFPNPAVSPRTVTVTRPVDTAQPASIPADSNTTRQSRPAGGVPDWRNRCMTNPIQLNQTSFFLYHTAGRCLPQTAGLGQ